MSLCMRASRLSSILVNRLRCSSSHLQTRGSSSPWFSTQVPRHSTTMDTATANDLALPVAPSSHESPSFLYDPIAQKFVNIMMWDGKKSLAQGILKEAFQIIKTTQLSKLKSKGGEIEVDPLVIFHRALENTQPIMGTTGVRRGGKLYHVPYPLPAKRRQFLASKWVIQAARDKSGVKTKLSMAQTLASELLEAYNNQGTAIKRKQDLHRLAEANRAFAHFRW